jgi:hypothetical protein
MTSQAAIGRLLRLHGNDGKHHGREAAGPSSGQETEGLSAGELNKQREYVLAYEAFARGFLECPDSDLAFDERTAVVGTVSSVRAQLGISSRTSWAIRSTNSQ